MPRQLARRRSAANLDSHPGGYEEFAEEAALGEEGGGPRRRRRTRETEPADQPRGQRSSRETSVSTRRGATRGGSTRISKGWEAVRKHKEESSSYASNFKVSDEEVLVKFLDDAPFVTYYQHWLQELDGKKSFVCSGADCPLCEIGDEPRFLAAFNVADLRDGEPEVKVWEASPQPAGEIQEMAKNARFKPINRDDLYFAVSRKKGKNGFWSYTLVPVKDRDLEDDWDIEPLTGDELDDLMDKRYDESIVRISTREDLLDVVEELNG